MFNNFTRGLLFGIIVTLVFVIARGAYAEYVPQPDDEIIVKRNGKVIGKMSRSEYKVVKLGTSKDFTTEETSQLITHHVDEYKATRKNRLTVKAGTGYYDMQRSFQNNTHTIDQRRDFLLGIGYSRMLTEQFSLGVSVHTNETITLDGGVDF
jgi:hypothetical protein